MKMKCILLIISVLSIYSVCLGKETTWGVVNRKTLEMGQQHYVASSGKSYTFTFGVWQYFITNWLILEFYSKLIARKSHTISSFVILFQSLSFAFKVINDFLISLLNFYNFDLLILQIDYDFFPKIGGIKHIDRASTPVSVKFIKGDVNSRSITIQIRTKSGHRGIDSHFYFYAKR